MPDAIPAIHFAFNMSAAGSIRQALADLGCHERVIGFPDNSSFGPINPPSATLRELWVGDHLGYEWGEIVQAADAFWAEAISEDNSPVVWVSRHCALEYSAFLEFIARKGDAPFRIIDATGIEVPWAR
jgi:hypothetical protein